LGIETVEDALTHLAELWAHDDSTFKKDALFVLQSCLGVSNNVHEPKGNTEKK